MENERLLKRLHELEEELQVLRQGLEPPAKNKWNVRLEKFSKSLNSHWSLVTLIIAGVTAIVAFTFFGVDPFESYRAIKTTRELSKSYSDVGDTLVFIEQWDAAEVAYRNALEIDKNNIQATYGIFRAEIFQPSEGQKYYVPEVADVKLDYLEKEFPDDYQTKFLRGVHYFNLQDYGNAIVSFSEAIDSNPGYATGYIQRGYVKQSSSDMEGACKDYNTALEKEKNNGVANNNVGYCDLLEQNFDAAIQHLIIGWRNSPKLITLINLGDAYLFTGRTEEALAVQQSALRLIEEAGEGIENERFVAGEWTFNFMPLSEDDKLSKNNSVKVFDIRQKSIFMHYNLSFGYAINGDFDTATKEFNIAMHLDNHGDYTAFFEQKMKSIRHFVGMNSDIQSWFEKQEEVLAQN